MANTSQTGKPATIEPTTRQRATEMGIGGAKIVRNANWAIAGAVITIGTIITGVLTQIVIPLIQHKP